MSDTEESMPPARTTPPGASSASSVTAGDLKLALGGGREQTIAANVAGILEG